MKLTVVILAFNEGLHIERCIESISGIADRIVLVDSGSTDDTIELARRAGTQILENPWVNYSVQFNWALEQLAGDTEWVLRLDADEVVTPELKEEIASKLSRLGADVDGIYVSRRMTFMRRPIRYGGVFPIRVLRLFRHDRGRCENRWMDEHIKVAGPTAEFRGEIIDDNINSLTWWTAKHNQYASREAVDLLNLEYGFMPQESVTDLRGWQQVAVKRWLKEVVYARCPGGLRAFLYFTYRYILRLGFLDGREGAAFHVLQGFWYRFLVDAKCHEVRRDMSEHGTDIVTAIERVLGIRVLKDSR